MGKKRDYTETEKQIFEAALTEFAQNGKKGARLQAIADAAGVNKALVHYYFRNKQHLYEEVFDYMYSRFFNCLCSALQGSGSFREMLESFIKIYMDFLKSYNGFSMLMRTKLDMEAGELKSKYQQMVRENGAAPSSVFAEKMEEFMDKGEVRPVDPFQAFITLLGSCNYLFIGYPVLSIAHPDLEKNWDLYVEQRKQHLIELLYRGLKNDN